MQGIMENDFIIDGVKSWIHCIHIFHKPPTSDLPHYHYHNYIELLYAIHSDATTWIDGDAYSFTDGDLIVINSGDMHSVIPSALSEYVCIKFSPQILYTAEQALLEYKYVMPFLSQNAHKRKFTANELENTPIPSLCMNTSIEWEKKDIAYELAIRSNILKIFSEIFRLNKANNPLIPNLQLTDVLKKAITYILDHYNTATEREVAQACNLSYNYFSFAFKKATGQNFNNYLTAIKLKEAEKLLVFSDASITDIAYTTGFSSASLFIARFKDYKQITPRQFRKKMQTLPQNESIYKLQS